MQRKTDARRAMLAWRCEHLFSAIGREPESVRAKLWREALRRKAVWKGREPESVRAKLWREALRRKAERKGRQPESVRAKL